MLADFTLAAVHPQMLAEVAGFTIRAAEIPQCGAAGSDGGIENFADGFDERLVPFPRNLSGGALRIYTGKE